MSHYVSATRDVILVYLQQEFPDCRIQEESNDDSYCFRLTGENQSYFVRVMYTAIESPDPVELNSQFKRLAVADTMRGLGDFPVVVTEYGCIFGSP